MFSTSRFSFLICCRNGSTRISCSGFLVEEDVWTQSDPSRRNVRSNSQQLGSDQWIITSALCVTPFLTKSGSNDLISSPDGAYASSPETQVEGSGWVLRPDTQVLVHFFDDTLENSKIRFLEASLDFVLPIPEVRIYPPLYSLALFFCLFTFCFFSSTHFQNK